MPSFRLSMLVRALAPTIVIAACGDQRVGGLGGQTMTNPMGCPAEMPAQAAVCPGEGELCRYAALGCTFDFECTSSLDCHGSGGCTPTAVWSWSTADPSCAPFVDCGVGRQGDTCMNPGQTCVESLSQCEESSFTCGEDHRWVVVLQTPSCCYGFCNDGGGPIGG